MKKLLFAMGLVATMAACSEDKTSVYEYPARPDVEPQPAVTLTPGEATHNSLEFTLTPANAEECSFYCIETEDDDKQLSAGEVIALGQAVNATESGTYKAVELYDVNLDDGHQDGDKEGTRNSGPPDGSRDQPDVHLDRCRGQLPRLCQRPGEDPS